MDPTPSSRDSRSPWFDTVSDQRRYPQLSGSHHTDYLVIGAGIAGCMTAWRLAEQGQRVTLIEANHIATGDTGLSTAFVTRVPDAPLADLLKVHGEPFMRRLFETNGQAQQYLRRLVKTHEIKCDWHDCNSLSVSYQDNDPKLAAEWEVLRTVEPRSHQASPEELQANAPTATAGTVIEHEARFDPRAFLLGLLQTPTGKTITVFEASPVKSIRANTVQTANGSITAKKIVIATGLPQPEFPELDKLFAPKVSYVIEARFTQVPVSADLVWDTDEPYQYYRTRGQSILLGGADTQPGADQQAAFEKLEGFLQGRLPGEHHITRRWSGSLFYTDDRLPYAAPHPHYKDTVYILSGFAGNGIVMGTACALVVSDLVLQGQSKAADLFAFERTKARIPAPTRAERGPDTQTWLTRSWITAAKISLPLIYLAALVIPAIVFFGERGGFGFLRAADTVATLSVLLFPLAGLYAFTLVWAQVMLGSSMPLWLRVYPWLLPYHRVQGVFALLFALLHPTLLLVAYGLAYFDYAFVAPGQKVFIYIGQIQLLIMIVTVATALLRNTRVVRSWWRYIHWANYAVFALAWVHSWYLGSDVQPTWLRYVWIFFAVTVGLSLAGRVVRGLRNTRGARVVQPGLESGETSATKIGRYVAVAKLADLPQNRAHCVTVEGQALALYRINERVFATTNTCTHQGGPLCQGSLSGTTIQCPWHGSRFDVTNGKLVGGPAQRPITSYQTRIRNGQVEIAL